MKHSVYCIRICGSPFRKLGISNNVKKRLSALKVGSPFPMEVEWHVVFADRKEANKAERVAHSELSAVRLSGEWFNLNGQAAQWIRRHLKSLRKGHSCTRTKKPEILKGEPSLEWGAVVAQNRVEYRTRSIQQDMESMRRRLRIYETNVASITGNLPGGRLTLKDVERLVSDQVDLRHTQHKFSWEIGVLEHQWMEALWDAYQLDPTREHPLSNWMSWRQAETQIRFRGLRSVHKRIDRGEAEWRDDHGFSEVRFTPLFLQCQNPLEPEQETQMKDLSPDQQNPTFAGIFGQ